MPDEKDFLAKRNRDASVSIVIMNGNDVWGFLNLTQRELVNLYGAIKAFVN